VWHKRRSSSPRIDGAGALRVGARYIRAVERGIDEALEMAKEGAFREIAALDAAYARGQIDDAGWHRGMAALIAPAYLNAESLRRGSGHSGSDEDWEWSRGIVMEGVNRAGTFLDVGCANGLLMESVERWGGERGLQLEAYGLEIIPELAERARERVPRFRERVFTGNALGWEPPRRYDFVRTGLEYVPLPRRRPLVAWLLEAVVTPGGRLIVGKYNEEVAARAVEHDLKRWGFAVAGLAERTHRSERRLAYRCAWIDAPMASADGLAFRSLAESDLAMMQVWLSRPHVFEWWRQPLDLDGVRSHYLPIIAGRRSTHVYVIQEHGRPIGWIQWYRWSSYPAHAEHIGAAPNMVGIDLAIAELDAIGRGLGSRVITQFLQQWVFVDPTIAACMTDPDERNIRSTRAFEKAGFTVVRKAHDQGQSRTSLVVQLSRNP
jgi:RimJ/RimL family protein N-acetyltransferase